MLTNAIELAQVCIQCWYEFEGYRLSDSLYCLLSIVHCMCVEKLCAQMRTISSDFTSTAPLPPRHAMGETLYLTCQCVPNLPLSLFLLLECISYIELVTWPSQRISMAIVRYTSFVVSTTAWRTTCWWRWSHALRARSSSTPGSCSRRSLSRSGKGIGFKTTTPIS